MLFSGIFPSLAPTCVYTVASESEGWTIHFIERETRYWIAAQAGQKTNELFGQGTSIAWEWAK